MALSFYNSLSKKKEKFIPINKDSVRLYTCGPTVYDVAHIGNFRTFIFEDLLKRFLLYKDYSVTHIMNITDVDDKTIRRSIKEDKTLAELTQKYTDLFFKDLTWMKVIPADAYPKATDHVNEMIEMIQILIEKEFAYLTKDNSIFFKISKYPDYGKLVILKVINFNHPNAFPKMNIARTIHRILHYGKDINLRMVTSGGIRLGEKADPDGT